MSDKIVIKSEHKNIHLKFFAGTFKLTTEHCRSFLGEYLGVAESIITIEALKGNIFQIALGELKNTFTIEEMFDAKTWHYVHQEGDKSYYVRVSLLKLQYAEPILIQGVPLSYSKQRVETALLKYGFVTSIEEKFKIFGNKKIYMGEYSVNIIIYDNLPGQIHNIFNVRRLQPVDIHKVSKKLYTSVMVFPHENHSIDYIKELFKCYGTDVGYLCSNGNHKFSMILFKSLPTEFPWAKVMYVDED